MTLVAILSNLSLVCPGLVRTLQDKLKYEDSLMIWRLYI